MSAVNKDEKDCKQRYNHNAEYMFEISDGDATDLKFISINASTLAAFCGRHRFKSQDDAFIEVLSRDKKLPKAVEGVTDDRISCISLCSRALVPSLWSRRHLHRQSHASWSRTMIWASGHMPPWSRRPWPRPKDIQALREKRPLMADLVEASTKAIRGTQAHRIITQTSVLDVGAKQLADKETKEIVRGVCSGTRLDTKSSSMLEERVRATWVRDRGTELESSAAAAIYETCPDGCKTREQVGGTLRIKIGDTAVWVFCRVDMAYVHKDSNIIETVFEIKNRRDRFFVPSYDLDQLCVYVLAMSAPCGQLVERCQGQQKMSYGMSLEEARTRFEMSILPSLRDAVSHFSRLVMDPTTYEASKLWGMLRADTT